MANLNGGNDLTATIPSSKTTDGVTHYTLSLQIGGVKWTVEKRYSAFADLHQQLVSNHGVAKDILPPKKLIGNKDPAFVEKRRQDLEVYLKNLLSFMAHTIPRELAEFVNLQHYEVTFLLQDLARYYFLNADSILQAGTTVTFQPLQLLAISERFKNPLPTNIEVEQETDFSHVADFCSQVTHLLIEGSTKPYKSSNIIHNELKYSLSTFKTIDSLQIFKANVRNIENVQSIRKTCKTLSVTHCNMEKVADVFLCDVLHKDCEDIDSSNLWPCLIDANFSRNKIDEIGPSVGLAPNIEKLDLSRNKLTEIDSLTKLPHLVSLNLSHNCFDIMNNVHMKLGNIIDLDLSQNNLSNLEGFAKLYSLVSLNVSSNNINDISSIIPVTKLPCLESLILNGNSVATMIDYRIKVLELYGSRCSEISLDNEPPTQQELDKVRVLQALRIAKEGKLPTLEFSTPPPTSLVSLPYCPPDEAIMANELIPKSS